MAKFKYTVLAYDEKADVRKFSTFHATRKAAVAEMESYEVPEHVRLAVASVKVDN